MNRIIRQRRLLLVSCICLVFLTGLLTIQPASAFAATHSNTASSMNHTLKNGGAAPDSRLDGNCYVLVFYNNGGSVYCVSTKGYAQGLPNLWWITAVGVAGCTSAWVRDYTSTAGEFTTFDNSNNSSGRSYPFQRNEITQVDVTSSCQ